MDNSKYKRLKEELEKARNKRDLWEARVKDLEASCSEAEKLYIYGIVRTENLTIEQLAELIRSAKKGFPHLPESVKENRITEETVGEECR